MEEPRMITAQIPEKLLEEYDVALMGAANLETQVFRAKGIAIQKLQAGAEEEYREAKKIQRSKREARDLARNRAAALATTIARTALEVWNPTE